MRTLDWKRENPSHGKSGPGAKIRCSNGHIVAVIKGDAALDVARSMVKKSICQDKDELRLRYKELAIYMVPGVGGSISVPCRRCAELNTLEDTRAIAQVTQGTRPKVD